MPSDETRANVKMDFRVSGATRMRISSYVFPEVFRQTNSRGLKAVRKRS